MSLNDKLSGKGIGYCTATEWGKPHCGKCDKLRAGLKANENSYEIAQGIIIEQQGKLCGLTEDNAALRKLCGEVRARLGRAEFTHSGFGSTDCPCDLCASKRLLDEAAGRGEGER
jgi:hypothetical protein